MQRALRAAHPIFQKPLMNALYHRQITTEALDKLLSTRAVETIIQANLHQDDLKYLLGGYPHHHFDNSEFDRTDAYLNEQRAYLLEVIARGERTSAWEAFGRITHTLQDFYAHSNYVRLWLEKNEEHGAAPPARHLTPEEIEAQLPELLTSPRLFTARVVLFLEILNMIPFIGPRLRPYFPPDVHARINLDNPSTGPLFPFAMAAARKRTEEEFKTLAQIIQTRYGARVLQNFTDLKPGVLG